MTKLNWPLMENNIEDSDYDCMIEFLKTKPRLTQGVQVEAFEREWSEWLGVKHSVFVNSGSSANVLTMAALKHLYGEGEIIVPALTWSSDISSVMHAGLKPVFVDVDPFTLALNEAGIKKAITPDTRAVFLTHVLGLNGLTDPILRLLEYHNIPLIEDVCESPGATHHGKKVGTFGLASNFSFYYAHHLTTIEGGMVSTNQERFYETVRMLRSHGLVREVKGESLKKTIQEQNPGLHPEFIFAYPGYNMRSTEIQAVLGRNQLKRLDQNNLKRQENFRIFLSHLNRDHYFTGFDQLSSVNYAFMIVTKYLGPSFCKKLEQALTDAGVEWRRGLSGGGNQAAQPYAQKIRLEEPMPQVMRLHHESYYVGNYPSLPKEKILALCELLNSL